METFENNQDGARDFNTEVRKEIHDKYPVFQDFYKAIIERTREARENGPQAVHTTDLSIDDIINILSAEAIEISVLFNTSTQGKQTDPDATVPAPVVTEMLQLAQKGMMKASAFYHGEINLMGTDGNKLNSVEWVGKK